jgi:hypothetical protein
MPVAYECPECERKLQRGTRCFRCDALAIQVCTSTERREDHSNDPRYAPRGRAKLFKG